MIIVSKKQTKKQDDGSLFKYVKHYQLIFLNISDTSNLPRVSWTSSLQQENGWERP